MQEQSIRDQVRKLITANKTDDAIELLSKVQLSAVDKQLIILTSQYNRVREELRLDVIGRDQAERKINQINLALIDLSHKVETGKGLTVGSYGSSRTSGGFNRNYLWLLLLPLLAVAVYYFNQGDNTNTSNPGGDPPIDTPIVDQDKITNSPVAPPPKSSLTLAGFRKDPAMVAYYPFDGNARNTLGHHHGEVKGGVTPASDRNGEAGKALAFDGKKGSIVDARTLLDLFSTHFSVAFWINPQQNDKGNIFGQYTTQIGDCIHCAALCNHCLGFVKDGKAIYYDEYPPDGGSEEIHTIPQNNIPNDKWTHVAFVRDRTRGKVYLYLNGELVAEDFETEAFKTNFGSPNRTWIGGRHMHPSQLGDEHFFQGRLDEFYVFNRGITAEEVQLLANDKN